MQTPANYDASPSIVSADLTAEFTDFMNANYAPALKYVRLRTVGHPDQEGLVQEAFLLVWEKGVQNKTLCERGWLFKVLRNKIGDVYRSKAVRDAEELLVDPYSIKNADEPTAIKTVEIRRTLQKLSAEFREVLLIVCGCDLTTAEAAKALGISQGALRIRLFRARREFIKVYSCP